MNDFQRIRQNVETMAAKGAPADHINGYLAQEGMTPAEFKAKMDAMPDTPGRAESALKYSAGSGVANLIDSVPRAVVGAGNLVRMGTGYLGNKLGLIGADEMPEPIPSDLLDVASPAVRKLGIVNDAYAPTDTTGKIIDTATQVLTGGGVNPAAIARSAANRLVRPIVRDVAAATASGIGAGTAQVLTENVKTGNESLDQLIKIAASLGGGAAGLPIAARGTAGDRAAAALKGVTAEQIAAAKALEAKALAAGSPITGYEAIQAVTGLNPKMQTQQRVAEQSDAAAKTLTPMMQGRPAANAKLIEDVTDGISPAAADPSTLAGQLQQAANDALDAARAQGNAKAAPYYATTSNSPTTRLPSSDWNAIASDPAVAWALEQTRKNPLLGVQGAAEGSLQWLDAAKKFLNDQSQSLGQTGQRFSARQANEAAQKITSAIDPIFPDYAKARSVVADNMANVVVPMEQGQVGKLAGTGSADFKKQSGSLLPDAPADVTPTVIQNTATTLGAQDPQILARFLAQDLRRKFNEQAQATQAGESTVGGANFAKNVAANAQQRENLIAALKASGANAAPLTDTLDIFGAQGMKPPVNSATAANAAEMSAGSSWLRPRTALANMLDSWQNGWASKDMAGALVAPNSVDRLVGLGRVNGAYSPTQQQMLADLLIANQIQ